MDHHNLDLYEEDIQPHIISIPNIEQMYLNIISKPIYLFIIKVHITYVFIYIYIYRNLIISFETNYLIILGNFVRF